MDLIDVLSRIHKRVTGTPKTDFACVGHTKAEITDDKELGISWGEHQIYKSVCVELEHNKKLAIELKEGISYRIMVHKYFFPPHPKWSLGLGNSMTEKDLGYELGLTMEEVVEDQRICMLLAQALQRGDIKAYGIKPDALHNSFDNPINMLFWRINFAFRQLLGTRGSVCLKGQEWTSVFFEENSVNDFLDTLGEDTPALTKRIPQIETHKYFEPILAALEDNTLLKAASLCFSSIDKETIHGNVIKLEKKIKNIIKESEFRKDFLTKDKKTKEKVISDRLISVLRYILRGKV